MYIPMQQAPTSQTPLKPQPNYYYEKRENWKGTEYRNAMRKSVARTFGDKCKDQPTKICLM